MRVFSYGRAGVIAAFLAVLLIPLESLAECGNAIIEPGEQCDKGELNWRGDFCCTPDCTVHSEGTPCDDRDECTSGEEICNSSGSCIPEVATCDDGDPCTTDHCSQGGCETWPAPDDSCETGEKSTLVIRDDLGSPDESSIRWKLLRGPELQQSDLGDPAATTSYRLCVFRQSGDVYERLAAGLTFGPSAAWTIQDPKGATYEDDAGSDDGVTAAQLRTGAAGRSKLVVTAGGANVPSITHFDTQHLFDPAAGLRVQLVNMENGRCWDSTFSTLRKDTESIARAKTP